MSSLFYFFRESLTGFARHLSTALGSIITIFLSLLIIGIFLVGGNMVNNVIASVENEVSITAYVSDEASQSDIDKVMDWLESQESVASVGFTTKEQAMENFKMEVANSLNVNLKQGYNGDLTSREAGSIGGEMVKRMIAYAESNMKK